MQYGAGKKQRTFENPGQRKNDLVFFFSRAGSHLLTVDRRSFLSPVYSRQSLCVIDLLSSFLTNSLKP
jgi:hypothetical protein